MGRAVVTVAELLSAVEHHLDDAALGDFLDGLADSARVAEAGWKVTERRVSQERYPDRNAEIRKRHRAGESYGQLSLDFGISPSGVAKVCQRGGKAAALLAQKSGFAP